METVIWEKGNLRLTFSDQPGKPEVITLHEQLIAHNDVISPYHHQIRVNGTQPLAIWLRDKGGEIVGGLTAETFWGWLSIDDLWLAGRLRGGGIGSEMLLLAEKEARMRGCTQAVLMTFEFQARDFYEKHGYRVIGELQDFPPGHSFFWMRKDFTKQTYEELGKHG